jgi:hypothetical protein
MEMWWVPPERAEVAQGAWLAAAWWQDAASQSVGRASRLAAVVAVAVVESRWVVELA